MSLFNPKTVAAALDALSRGPTESEQAAAARWAAMARADFDGQNESQIEPELNSVLMQGALGYRALGPDGPGTIKAKQPIGAGTVDLAVGEFTATSSRIFAPFELKGPKTGLDSIMPGRAKTPVQQAWEYANDAVGARWVLVSNMRELRLYAVGHGRAEFESFDLRQIDELGELKRLQLLLHADQLLSGATADLLIRSATEDQDITNALYADYRRLRDDLLGFVSSQRPHVTPEARIALIQKLLDRLIFLAFAEDSVLVPDDSIRRAVEFLDPYDPRPRWRTVCRLFDAVDKGAGPLGIPPYNGGLFASDAELDALDLPDDLVQRFLDISKYDYKSEVSVTILGHIFEQSISDIESMQAEARGEQQSATGTRKRFGVVYTPDFVTRFIVEQTVGAHLQESADKLLAQYAKRTEADGSVIWRSKTAERDYWRAYLESLTQLRIVDPACGSGAFLIAAFDHLHAEQKRVRERLGELDGGILAWADPNADVEIITRNLYGVDVNAESVEITKLALWLKTAKRGRPLESLELNIRHGNSLIEDTDYHSRAFVWHQDFREIFAEGGFDIVLGNPPYVRMELLKPIKPYLEARYEVVADRADLYAYFFELGLRVLKPGGRLGYICSSTFFRTGSGSPLRRHLTEVANVESVVDFGDLQLFEGVTTYPAILVLRKRSPGDLDYGNLRFLNLREMPADISAAFADGAEQMPRDRLTSGSWRFEGDRLNTIRAKISAGRRTLAEVYGRPVYGIKTGLNQAFVVSREVRDRLIDEDRRSAELLKPFLVGESLKRWHVESEDLWLIYTPRNRVQITEYPAIRAHLEPFRNRLENRATQQEWWELQQAQAAYQSQFEAPKLAYPEMSQGPKFSIDRRPHFVSNKVFFLPVPDPALVAVLGSKVIWLTLFGDASPLRGGQWRLELREQYVSRVPMLEPGPDFEALRPLGDAVQSSSEQLAQLVDQVHHRLTDIAPAVAKVSAFRDWPSLTFADLRSLLLKRCRIDIPLGERDEWDQYLTEQQAQAGLLRTRVADAEAEINARVYALYDLQGDEIRAIEDALTGQY